MTKHTPAPWKVDIDWDERHPIAVIDPTAIDAELKALECPHPPTRLYSWHVGDTLCVGCCECGAVLAGNAAQKV